MKDMKRMITALMALTLAISGLSARELPEIHTPASDSRVTYVGRTLKEKDNVSFDWTGVYVRIRFEGTYLAMKASDSKAN